MSGKIRNLLTVILLCIFIPSTFLMIRKQVNDRTGDDAYQEANYMDSIFLECGNSPDFTDYNTVIYVHNLRSGAMFTAVRQYMNRKRSARFFWIMP